MQFSFQASLSRASSSYGYIEIIKIRQSGVEFAFRWVSASAVIHGDRIRRRFDEFGFLRNFSAVTRTGLSGNDFASA